MTERLYWHVIYATIGFGIWAVIAVSGFFLAALFINLFGGS